jgi:two-component system phosphate regulon response regulator OmpR
MRAAIIFLTAQANPEDRVRGLELGADDYVPKPFHFRELLLRVQNCLKRAQSLAEPVGELPAGPVGIGRARVDFERFAAEVEGRWQPLTHECAVLRREPRRQGGESRRDPDVAYAGVPDLARSTTSSCACASWWRRMRPSRA